MKPTVRRQPNNTAVPVLTRPPLVSLHFHTVCSLVISTEAKTSAEEDLYTFGWDCRSSGSGTEEVTHVFLMRPLQPSLSACLHLRPQRDDAKLDIAQLGEEYRFQERLVECYKVFAKSRQLFIAHSPAFCSSLCCRFHSSVLCCRL
jgi:hypothetical protein